MSHTFEFEKTRFICNSDFSGDIMIVDKVNNEHIHVANFDELEQFVLLRYKNELLHKIENEYRLPKILDMLK